LTVTGLGVATGQSATASGTGAATVTITQPATTTTVTLGAAGADTVTITGNTTAYGAGVSLTGGTQTGVSDTFALVDGTGGPAGGGLTANISAAAITGFEVLDLSQAGKILDITMTAAQNNAFTSVNQTTDNDIIRISAAGSVNGLAETAGDDLTYVLATGTNTFTASTTATDYKVTGGTANTYNMGLTLTSADTLTGGSGNDVLVVTGTGGATTAVTAIETIQFTTSTAAQTLTLDTAFDTGVNTTVTAAASTVAVTIHAGASTSSSATGTTTDTLTIIDGPGNDAITIPAADADRVLTTLTLSSGGADRITFTNAAVSGTGLNFVTVNNFTTGIAADADSITGLSLTSYQTLASAGAVTTSASLVEVNSGVVAVTSFDASAGGIVEVALDNAMSTYGGADGSSFYTIVYGAGAQANKAALYGVTVTTAATGITATNIVVELVGVFNTITADSFVSANFS
jgi:hypothetical protein